LEAVCQGQPRTPEVLLQNITLVLQEMEMLGYLALLFATAVGHVTPKLPITQNYCDN
jgi:hypothetical protein